MSDIINRPNTFLNNGKPFIIFLDGTDGVGKSTIAKELKLKYNQMGFYTDTTCIMKFTEAGYMIRDIAITEPMQDEILFLGFCFSVFYNLKKIIENKKSLQVMIVDRSPASTFAQNIAAPHIPERTKSSMFEIFDSLQKKFNTENKDSFANFLLELDPKIAFERIKQSRKELDVYEQRGIEFQRRIASGYRTHYEVNNNPLNTIINTENTTITKVIDLIYQNTVEHVKCHLTKNT